MCTGAVVLACDEISWGLWAGCWWVDIVNHEQIIFVSNHRQPALLHFKFYWFKNKEEAVPFHGIRLWVWEEAAIYFPRPGVEMCTSRRARGINRRLLPSFSIWSSDGLCWSSGSHLTRALLSDLAVFHPSTQQPLHPTLTPTGIITDHRIRTTPSSSAPAAAPFPPPPALPPVRSPPLRSELAPPPSQPRPSHASDSQYIPMRDRRRAA